MEKIKFLFLLSLFFSFSFHNTHAQSVSSESSAPIKIMASSAKASSYQAGTPIEYSIDGKSETFYHSNWNNSASNYLPITLDYYFTKSFNFASFTYYPRQDGSNNGNFKEFEVWVSTENNTDYTKIGDYNFEGRSKASTVTLPVAITKVKSVRYIVKSGADDSNGKGLVSCSEMEFYEQEDKKEPTPTPEIDGVKISVTSANASSYQTGTPIENSIDGKSETFYHSDWKNSASNYFPITLDYNFSKSFDFIGFIYNPRQDGGSNGNFKEFEVWVSTENNANYTKIGDYNFEGRSQASTISLSTAVKGVKSVRFIVKSGKGTGNGFASCSEMEFYGKQPITGKIEDDIKVQVARGDASSFQPNSPIGNSFDNNFSTIYHSKWNNSVVNYFPITLNYYFDNAPNIDYLTYYPRQDGGTNGNFKEFEIWVSTQNNANYTKIGDYDFGGRTGASAVSFATTLKGVKSVRFVVKSGAGDGQGFVSCSEMAFYERNPNQFDYSLIFTDSSCSELKKGITEKEINQLEDSTLKKLALDIYQGVYDKEFRIQLYKPYQLPQIMKVENKISGSYSYYDNPTGISVHKDDEMVIFMNENTNQGISVAVQDLESGYGGANFPIMPGANKIKMPSDGLLYIMYNTTEATEAAVKINITGGEINGYFDSQKHTASDWNRLIKAAVNKHFDVLGEYAHLTFPTADLKKNTTDGKSLIDIYDRIVLLEQDFMGLVKYNKMFKNKMYYTITYNANAYMYASGDHTAYASSTMSYLTNPKLLPNQIWGPAHETGHINQTRGLKWIGMSEVTNNIYSMYVRSSFIGTSRLEEVTSGYKNTYEKGFNTFVLNKIPHNYPKEGTLYANFDADLFCKLIPFWQLKLYFHDVKGDNDFYKDLYEYLRTHADISSDGLQQLNFVKVACQVGQEDLTDFFESWGFLSPIDININDYSTARFQITQQQIDQVKSEIAAMNLPKPKLDIKYLTDNLVQTYKNNRAVVVTSVRLSGISLIVNAQNVAAYEVYDADILKSIHVTNQFSLGSNNLKNIKVYAVSVAGEKKQVYPTIAKSMLRSISSEEVIGDLSYNVKVVDRSIYVEPDTHFEVYSINGSKMNSSNNLLPGVYLVVINDNYSVKVIVK